MSRNHKITGGEDHDVSSRSVSSCNALCTIQYQEPAQTMDYLDKRGFHNQPLFAVYGNTDGIAGRDALIDYRRAPAIVRNQLDGYHNRSLDKLVQDMLVACKFAGDVCVCEVVHPVAIHFE